MKLRELLGLFICLISVVPAMAQDVAPRESLQTIPFATIDEGTTSQYHFGDLSFSGIDALIGDNNTWKEFWEANTEGILPPPELPHVNFKKEMVIVTLSGAQFTAAATTKIFGVTIDNK